MKSGCMCLVVLGLVLAANAETARWQAEIDAAAAKGGGVVSVPKGRHLVGQLDLRSNVELHLEEGAVLEGKVGLEHYRVTELPYSEGTWSAIVFGQNVTNVAITGKGVIYGFGQGWEQPAPTYPVGQEGLRARGIFFADSKDIRLEDFTLRDAACWGIVFKCCDGVVARRVTIDSHGNTNNDGFDVEAKNVLIEDCDVDSGDDAFCIKSNNPDFAVENVTFRNCIGRSHCNVCKIGTATRGTVRNIRFENIRCEPPRRDFIDRRTGGGNVGRNFFFRPGYPDFPMGVGHSMAAIENVDGGRVEDVVVDGLTGYGYQVPLFVRGGNRPTLNRLPHGNQYVFRNVTIRNVKAEGADPTANSISGVERMPVENVALENIDIICRGAGGEASERAKTMPVPDVSKRYPECMMFRPSILPAYGLYADRVNGLTLKNVNFRIKDGAVDTRSPIYLTESVSCTDEVLKSSLVEVVSTVDGMRQPCWFWAPEKAKDVPVPLIVGVHTWSGDILQTRSYLPARRAAEKRGWAFIGPNFRGPNQNPESCGSDFVVQDVVDAVDFARKTVKIDSQEIGGDSPRGRSMNNDKERV